MAQSYSTLFDGFESDAAAKAARDADYRKLRAHGFKARRWVLRNQLRQYASFGVPDGRSCDVYMLDMDRDGFAVLAERHGTQWFTNYARREGVNHVAQ